MEKLLPERELSVNFIFDSFSCGTFIGIYLAAIFFGVLRGMVSLMSSISSLLMSVSWEPREMSSCPDAL